LILFERLIADNDKQAIHLAACVYAKFSLTTALIANCHCPVIVGTSV